MIPTSAAHWTLWPRCLTSYAPGEGGSVLRRFHPSADLGDVYSAIAAHMSQQLLWTYGPGPAQEAVDSLAESLLRLDRENGGGWQTMTEGDARLELIRKLHSSRVVFSSLERVRPTLPSATLRRAMIVEGYSPERVYLDDDVDGLSVLLSRSASVGLRKTGGVSEGWLKAAGQHTRAQRPVSWLRAERLPRAAHDFALVTAGAPPQTLAALGRAVRTTRPGAKIGIRVFNPWEAGVASWLEAAGCKVLAAHRGLDQQLLPGPFVVEGGGDLIIIERPVGGDGALVGSESLRSQRLPFDVLEFDGPALAPDREPVLHDIATLMGEVAPLPEGSRHAALSEGGHHLRWIDQAGRGISAQHTPADAHLLVVLYPYDPQVAWAMLSVITQVTGRRGVRMRSARCRVTGLTPVLG